MTPTERHLQSALRDALEENGRLRDVLPAMLEALIGVVRIADRKTIEFDAARAAIAKARTALSQQKGKT